MAIFRNQAMPMQPLVGIGGLFGGLRRPMFPPLGGFGGFGGGRFRPPPFNPMMQGGSSMGGGFFGGFRPRFRRRQRAPMPDFAGQISSLEAKIAELQEQLAARQAVPAPGPVMAVAEPKIGTLGGTGSGEFPLGTAGPRIPPAINVAGGMVPSNIKLPDIDVEAIKERIANLNIDVGERADMPVVPKGRPVVSLPPQDVGGRKKLTKGPGTPKKKPIKPPSIERIPLKPPSIERIMPPMATPADLIPRDDLTTGFTNIKRRTDIIPPQDVPQLMPMPAPVMPEPMPMPVMTEPMPTPIRVPEPMPVPIRVPMPIRLPEPMPMPAPVMPAPVMPAPTPMPSLPKFTMPQIAAPMPVPVMPAPMQMAPAGRMRGRGGRMR